MVAKGRLYCDQTHGLFKPQSVLNMEIPEWEKCIPTFFVCSAAMVGPEWKINDKMCHLSMVAIDLCR